jgi:hypothetical protein
MERERKGKIPMTPIGVVISDTPYMKEHILFGMAPRAEPSKFWVQNQETGIQKSLSQRNVHLRSEMLIFLKLCRSASIAGSARLENNCGLLISRRSYNKRSGFQPCAH